MNYTVHSEGKGGMAKYDYLFIDFMGLKTVLNG